MADWDDDSFEPAGLDDKLNTDKWEGEDEEDDSIKDNWDDDDDEKPEEKKEDGQEGNEVPKPKKKRTLKEAIKEKEAKKIEEAKLKAELKKRMEEEEETPMTQEELMAEKLRKQKLVEDSDLLLAMDTFGTSKEEITGKNTLDSMNPSTREDFTEYSKLLVEKLSQFESNVVYVQFLEDTLRDLCASLDADDIKKLSHCLNLLHSEKLKAQKGKTKGKAKAKKAGLTAGKSAKKDDMDYDFGNEFDDFI